jgi:hypothetical protein
MADYDIREPDFTVEAPREDQPYYCVSLPHQCENWVVACSENKDEAAEEMARFVNEAQRALEKLRSLGS